MSALLEIQQQLGTIQQRIVALERALSDHPSMPSVIANLESAVRIRGKLEAQFAAQAAKSGYDVCRYRAFDDHDRQRAGPAFGAIASFQKVVSVVYGALKYGQKQRATISEAVENETAFGFGYAFQGSVEVVLTLRQEVLLEGIDSTLDESIDTIFSMTKAVSAADVKAYAAKLGPGPINALYEWADGSAKNGLGADIEWRKGPEVRQRLIVQRQELRKLSQTIERTSSQTEEVVTIDGVLIAADVSKNRFKIRREGLPEIRGTVANGAIDEKHRVSLPAPYVATIRITKRTKFSTGTEDVEYHLLKLHEPPQKP